MNKFYILFLGIICTVSNSFAGPPPLDWRHAVQLARGQTVDWYMWGGSPPVNTYVNEYLATELKSKYGVTLRQVPVKDIAEVVNKLLVEKQAGKNDDGSVDLMWINGENFRTCKTHQLLFGPFADQLPHQHLVDWRNPTVSNDFGTPVEGMESPWGSAQMVMIYDSARTPQPPRTVGELRQWIAAHPGRFTYPAPPDFTGSVFVRHLFYHLSTSPTQWQQPYSPGQFRKTAQATYEVLKTMKKSLWREGNTYPDSPERMNALFADGEIDFSFSYDPGTASRNILNGQFPKTVRTYVFKEGTIGNTHFVAIPYNAKDKAGAMVVANLLLSPEAQLKKVSPGVWGDLPAITINRLDSVWQQKFKELPRGPATLSDAELQAHRLPEPPSGILVDLEKGWQQYVLKQ